MTATNDTEPAQVQGEFTVPPSKCVAGRWYHSDRYGRVLCCGSPNVEEFIPAFVIRNHKNRTELRFLADTTDLLRECEQSW